MSALKLRGTAQVLSIDRIQERLEATKALGAKTINFDDEDPIEAIKNETDGEGAICIDAVGFESVGHHERQ
ncbi:MAG: hypothetical protein ACYC7D_00560 [Nitrososphaerales archaeon]